MRGLRGKELIVKMIEEAGPEIVKVGYETRLRAHVKEIGLGVA